MKWGALRSAVLGEPEEAPSEAPRNLQQSRGPDDSRLGLKESTGEEDEDEDVGPLMSLARLSKGSLADGDLAGVHELTNADDLSLRANHGSKGAAPPGPPSTMKRKHSKRKVPRRVASIHGLE